MNAKNSIYRKAECPFGRKAIALLHQRSIEYEDHVFASKQEEEAFKAQQGVATTPQIFLAGDRIGGYTDLAKRLGVSAEGEKDKTSYWPVAAVFFVTAMLSWATSGGVMGFMGYSLAVLALLKLMDTGAFRQSFEKYDLVAQRVSVYGKLYPAIELALGLSVLAGTAPVLTGGVALGVGIIGSISVFKAVYVDKKDLNCACVGGNSKVPLGVVSFFENAVMVAMAVVMLTRAF